MPIFFFGGEGLLDWYFDNNDACRTDFWPKWSFLNKIFWPMFRLSNWKFTKFRHYKQNYIGKFFFYFIFVKMESYRTEECWKGVLWSSWGNVKRGSLPPDIPVTHFKVSTPSGLWLSASATKIWSLNLTHSFGKVTALLWPETIQRQLREQTWRSCELKILICLRILFELLIKLGRGINSAPVILRIKGLIVIIYLFVFSSCNL